MSLLFNFRESFNRWPVLSELNAEGAVWSIVGTYVVRFFLLQSRGWVGSLGTLPWVAAILAALLSIRQQPTALAYAGAALAYALYQIDQKRAKAAFDREHAHPLTAKRRAS